MRNPHKLLLSHTCVSVAGFPGQCTKVRRECGALVSTPVDVSSRAYCISWRCKHRNNGISNTMRDRCNTAVTEFNGDEESCPDEDTIFTPVNTENDLTE